MSLLDNPLFRKAAFRPVRIVVGAILIVGGALGFLPVLGFWMIPLGVMVLSIDMPAARRLRRRFDVWWGRRRQRKAAERAARETR